ncbi:MAG: ABC transporter permease subunit [Chloroflexi bacterium]|nr:ABC transporter permease subunit [Chloroflexota bacterium]MCI0578030.1 ABC transporter permease subunit [Chloroflexota bacterium]MCI0644756.1 ABC transporter permease subunit [Chloroflexota bacterium]MCI0728661.1 ABC transporter permease subunit [Chloroflexota bacterium]
MIFDWLAAETAALLWRGLLLTVGLTAVTSLLALAAGVAAGTARLSRRRWLRWLAAAYVEVHRNVPALVLIVFWAFALPNVFPAGVRRTLFFDNGIVYGLQQITGFSVPYYVLAAGLALTLNTSAYLAELFRAGVGTIAQEHLDAARSLGASQGAVFWQIVLPQGLRAVFPAVATRLIHNMKNTALAAFVSTPEFFHSAQTAITRSFRAVELLLLAAGVYLALSFLFSSLLGWLEGRLDRRPRRAAAPQPAGGWQAGHV